MTTKLHDRYRLLTAGFLDGPRAPVWRERLGSGLDDAVALLAHVLANDLTMAPKDIDGEHLGGFLSTLLPARLAGNEPYRNDIVDLLEDLMSHIGEAEGLSTQWEWTNAIDAGRDAFSRGLADPDRSMLAPPRHEPDRRPAAKIGRNDPCPCGSGNKYKRCCLRLGNG